jgi:uncharacterized OB-fold protein
MENLAEGISVDKCTDCGKHFVSPVYVCSACGSDKFKPAMINGQGKIYSHTTIRIAPDAFRDQAPYPMAIVELPHDLRMTARILLKEGEKMEIGKEVACIRKNESGYWFELK